MRYVPSAGHETELDWTGVDSIANFLYHGSVDLWRKKNKKNLKRRSCGPSYGWETQGEIFRHSHRTPGGSSAASSSLCSMAACRRMPSRSGESAASSLKSPFGMTARLTAPHGGGPPARQEHLCAACLPEEIEERHRHAKAGCGFDQPAIQRGEGVGGR